jgi:hypothetical protein
MKETKHRKTRQPSFPPIETSDELRARLRVFAELTRERIPRPDPSNCPQNISVLAGPLRRRRRFP